MQFSSKPIEEHREVPLADEGHWEALVEHWENRQTQKKALGAPNDTYVVSIERTPTATNAPLKEILGLVEAQGDRVVGHERRWVRRIEPKTLLSKGVLADIATQAQDHGANLLVFDAELSSSQARNIEDTTGLAVTDREAIILNVFLQNAKTRRARIQVELAQLAYLRPRVRGLGLDMDQQAGGIMQGRGPGETASELLARQLDGRMAELRRTLIKLDRAAETQRKRRSTRPRIVLVGYTNAGKTSLMNALTDAGLSAKDAPFETLDATARCLTRHGGPVLISDTVGFIRRLPERLLESFASTLAEVSEATVIALVIDASDPERDLHLKTTERMLEQLGADRVPRVYVFNKMDRWTTPPKPEVLRAWSRGHAHVALSSRDPEAVEGLKKRLLRAVRSDKPTRLFVPYASKDIMSTVHARTRILASTAKKHGMRFWLEGDPEVLAQIQRSLRRAQD